MPPNYSELPKPGSIKQSELNEDSKIKNSLKDGNNIEIRGFGTISRKLNKEKFVRNPKTNEKIYKDETYKIHFKIGKILHNRINSEKWI